MDMFYFFIAEAWPAGTFLVVQTSSIFNFLYQLQTFYEKALLAKFCGIYVALEWWSQNVSRYRTRRTYWASNVNTVLCVGFYFRKHTPADFMFQIWTPDGQILDYIPYRSTQIVNLYLNTFVNISFQISPRLCWYTVWNQHKLKLHQLESIRNYNR